MGEREQTERQRFEAYFLGSRHSKGTGHRERLLELHEDGTYVDDHTQRHWWTWQNAVGLVSIVSPAAALADARGGEVWHDQA